jgi:hypothetical protein
LRLAVPTPRGQLLSSPPDRGSLDAAGDSVTTTNGLSADWVLADPDLAMVLASASPSVPARKEFEFAGTFALSPCVRWDGEVGEYLSCYLAPQLLSGLVI